MASRGELRQQQGVPSEAVAFNDNGGMRTGMERRRSQAVYNENDRRTGKDRRRGFDRRSGIDRRRTDDRRIGRYFRDGESVERRDVFRKRNAQ